LLRMSGMAALMIQPISHVVDIAGPPHGAPRSVDLALLFTDVVDFTGMVEKMGDEAALAVMERHDEVIREQVDLYGGDIVEVLGDGFVLAFQTPQRALACATAIQRKFAERTSTLACLQLRIGAHCGRVLERGAGLYFGRDVILTARIAAAAAPGQILVSEQLGEAVEFDLQFALGACRKVALKGLASAQGVRSAEWRHAAPPVRRLAETASLAATARSGTPRSSTLSYRRRDSSRFDIRAI
jgi:class 3 adenylate cyclase